MGKDRVDQPHLRTGHGRRRPSALGCSLAALLAGALVSASGCSLFRLAEDLEAMERSYVIDGIVANPDRYEKVYAFSIERDSDGRIVSADRARAGMLGAFAFVVEGAEGHYVLA